MRIFQKNKNLLLTAYKRLLNSCNVRGTDITAEELIYALAGEDGLPWNKMGDILKMRIDELFEDVAGNIAADPVPFPLSDVEIFAAQEMKRDGIIRAVLPGEVLSALPDGPERNYFDSRMAVGADRNISQVFAAVCRCIEEGRKMRVNGMDGIPYKIIYSLRDDTLKLLFIEDEVKKISLWDIESAEPLDEAADAAHAEKMLGRESMTLRVMFGDADEDKRRNILERCFLLFGNHERSACGRGNDIIVKIKYYAYERPDMIRDILSLGKYVIVEEPLELRREITEIIRGDAGR